MKQSLERVRWSRFAVLTTATTVGTSPPCIVHHQGNINTNGLGFIRGKRNQQPDDYKP